LEAGKLEGNYVKRLGSKEAGKLLNWKIQKLESSQMIGSKKITEGEKNGR